MLLYMIVSSNLRCNIARNNEIINLEVLSAAQHFEKFTGFFFYVCCDITDFPEKVRETSAK